MNLFDFLNTDIIFADEEYLANNDILIKKIETMPKWIKEFNNTKNNINLCERASVPFAKGSNVKFHNNYKKYAGIMCMEFKLNNNNYYYSKEYIDFIIGDTYNANFYMIYRCDYRNLPVYFLKIFAGKDFLGVVMPVA